MGIYIPREFSGIIVILPPTSGTQGSHWGIWIYIYIYTICWGALEVTNGYIAMAINHISWNITPFTVVIHQRIAGTAFPISGRVYRQSY